MNDIRTVVVDSRPAQSFQMVIRPGKIIETFAGCVPVNVDINPDDPAVSISGGQLACRAVGCIATWLRMFTNNHWLVNEPGKETIWWQFCLSCIRMVLGLFLAVKMRARMVLILIQGSLTTYWMQSRPTRLQFSWCSRFVCSDQSLSTCFRGKI